MVPALLLTLLLSAQTPEKIALVFGPKAEDVEIVRVDEARAEYQVLSTKLQVTEVERKRLAALEIALGTRITPEAEPKNLSMQDRERFRWHRQSLQGVIWH